LLRSSEPRRVLAIQRTYEPSRSAVFGLRTSGRMQNGARAMSANTACRVAIVAHEPLLREGLGYIVASDSVEVVGSVESLAELAALSNSFDVVVVHIADANEVLAVTELGPTSARIVGVHDSLASAVVGAALAGGVTTMVDTSSAASVLIDAVVGSGAVTRLRWSRPTIGPMPLSPRERSVLALIAAGNTSPEIGAALEISTRTVERHKQRIFERLGVQNQAHAVAIAVRSGILAPDPTSNGVSAGRRR
jgi:DNA-binding NarL/FixJ family response regulator